jgi:hypothetical protein
MLIRRGIITGVWGPLEDSSSRDSVEFAGSSLVASSGTGGGEERRREDKFEAISLLGDMGASEDLRMGVDGIDEDELFRRTVTSLS